MSTDIDRDTTASTLKRLLAVAIAGVAVAALSVAAAHAAPPVPDAIEVEQGNHLFLKAHAVGVQSYSCNATVTATGYAWTFIAPNADLFHGQGKQIGRHYAGPTWEWEDGSWVKAARVDGVTVDPTAIPWLLLKVTSRSADPMGRLYRTTFVQRINTTGGLAPSAASCDASTVGTHADVPYTADYLFFTTSGR